jgi:chromosome segregation ATPase
MQIFSMGTTPAEIEKQAAAYEKQKQGYQVAHQEWLKGRDIQILEDRAKLMIENAKVEAKAIVDNAKDYVAQIEIASKEGAKAKQELEALKAEALADRKKAQELRAEAEALRQEVKNLEGGLRIEHAACKDKRIKLAERIEKLRTFLSGFDGDIA